MDKSSMSKGQVIFPVAFVNGAVSPLLDSSTVSLIVLPLSVVNIFLFELNRRQWNRVSNLQRFSRVGELAQWFFFSSHYLSIPIRHGRKLDAACSELQIVAALINLGVHDWDWLFSLVFVKLLAFLGWSRLRLLTWRLGWREGSSGMIRIFFDHDLL